jgi:transcriptional regulator with XRE-family HTH domain
LVVARKKAGLTQMQVADRLSKPQSYVAKIEGSDRKLDVLEFVTLCQVINIDPSEMIQHLKN